MTTSLSLPVMNNGSEAAPECHEGAAENLELAHIHNFATKLTQPLAKDALKAYVEWQARRRSGASQASERDCTPPFAPISINLDLTTACNYACDHCVDMDILNTSHRYDHARLLSSLQTLAERGLRSVIVIGGGEPTLYPKFVETIHFMKDLGLQVAIVSNGSRNDVIADAAERMDANDWIRLSLDAGADRTFQLMHKPKKPVTLEQICGLVPAIRERNPEVIVGFSFIVTWKGAMINDAHIVENLDEVAAAARLARDSRFSYIAFKPFLTRDEAFNSEVIGVEDDRDRMAGVVERLRRQIEQAKHLETPEFRVYETTGLKALTRGHAQDLGRQPRQCHMQFFRQVLSPLGLYNCPVYRNQPHGQLGDKNACSDAGGFEATRRTTADRITQFNATDTCAKVTCLYNDANWWIERLIQDPRQLDHAASADGPPDYFL